ncbi:MAG: hypothetical protein V4607_04980 [Pseudomonadota bacterium]
MNMLKHIHAGSIEAIFDEPLQGFSIKSARVWTDAEPVKDELIAHLA